MTLPLILLATQVVTIDLDRLALDVRTPCDPARQELVKHLKLVSGRAPAESGDVTIVLGEPAPGEKAEPFTAAARLVGDRLYLWGDRPETTQFAVYGFLERVLGVRWVMPGDDGIVCTPRRTVELPADWNWRYVPPLADSKIRVAPYKGGSDVWAELLPNALRRPPEVLKRIADDRVQWTMRMRQLCKERIHLGHSFTKWNDRFHATHPEYLALQADGRRGTDKLGSRAARFMKLCLTCDGVIDEIVAEWERAGRPKQWNVCPNDGYEFCRCEKCRALDVPPYGDTTLAPSQHLSDRYVSFWNRLAARMVAVRSDVMLMTYAYSLYREPPRRERIRYGDNMIFGMVPSQEDDNLALIRGWKAAGMKHFKLRPNYLCYRGALPRGYERYFLDNFKMNLREGMVGTDYDAGLRSELMGFEAYAIARAIQEPDVSFEAVEAEWLSQFGAAAPLMKTYYARIRERGETALFAAQRRDRAIRETALDDSLLADTVCAANPRDELERDLGIVRMAERLPGLTELERRRVTRVVLLAEHAIRTRDFRMAFDGERSFKPEFLQTGLDLIDFRIRIAPRLPQENWGALFRLFPFEVKWWRQPPLKEELQKRFPEIGFAG